MTVFTCVIIYVLVDHLNIAVLVFHCRRLITSNVSLQMDMQLVKWKNNLRTIPKSICSEPCKPGEVQSSKSVDSCCWVCIRCTEFEIMDTKEGCIICPNGSLPNWNKTRCVDLPVSYMVMNSAWAIVPVIFSIIGIILVIFTFAVFIKFDSTPVIMASGRELCYVLLFGLLMCYAMTFVMVAKPTIATCAIMRLGLGLSLSLCYAALLTKTNRISRIFNRGVKAMVKRPSYTSPRSQLVICFTLVSVQIIGAVTWVCMDFPLTTHVFPDRYTVVLRCKSTNISIVISLLYNMLLILMCTVYAFKTRKIPENFNEAKYIAFTMYSTCIVWLAFIPIYFGTHKSDFRVS